MPDYTIKLRRPHDKQRDFVRSDKKRKIIRAGRRGGKTTGVSIYSIEKFLQGKRILYATPTQDQVERFWFEITKALRKPIADGIFYKNETMHIIEVKGTENRIRAKTAWNADTLRGDYADELIFDEFQLMNEEVWETVGVPMLADNDGNATFIYTPPSLRSRSTIKARDPQYAAKLFRKAQQDKTGRWEAFHFTSFDNPHISKVALDEISSDMTALSYRMEILAEDIQENPGALWTRDIIESYRSRQITNYEYVVIGVDPSATRAGDEAGIIAAGKTGNQLYILGDHSMQGSPLSWATKAIEAYHFHKANKIVAEGNNGGEMVADLISQIDPNVPVEIVYASRGKQTRAEPVSAVYEQGRAHHIGDFYLLEDEMCLWTPGDPSPNRMDALVWAATSLIGQSWWMS